MTSHQQMQERVRECDYVLMFFEEVEQTTTFWLWYKYRAHLKDDEPKWAYHREMLLLAAFHASLLSIRKLNDFFDGSRGRSSDIKADRFTGFDKMSAPLGTPIQEKLNRYLAHMTFQGADERLKDWNVDELAHPIYERALEFCEHLLTKYFDPVRDAELCQQTASFKSGLQQHIKRTKPV